VIEGEAEDKGMRVDERKIEKEQTLA